MSSHGRARSGGGADYRSGSYRRDEHQNNGLDVDLRAYDQRFNNGSFCMFRCI